MTAVTVPSEETTGGRDCNTSKEASKTAQGMASGSGSVLHNLWPGLGFREVLPIWAWPCGGQAGVACESGSGSPDKQTQVVNWHCAESVREPLWNAVFSAWFSPLRLAIGNGLWAPWTVRFSRPRWPSDVAAA